MKSHHPTTRRPRRKRHPADEAATLAGAHEAEANASIEQSVAMLRDHQAGHAARGAAALGLQRAVGNAQVARELAAIQRYDVGAAPDASCEQVIKWIDAHSPYKPEWAHTKAAFTWSAGFQITGDKKSGFTLTVTDPTVDINKDVDMPEWQPASGSMQKAWRQAYTQLRNHEAKHEEIGDTWQATLLTRLKTLSISVKSANLSDKQMKKLVQAEWNKWIAEHQKAQKAIDPYTATLNCPIAEADSADGGGDEGADSAEA